MRANRGNDRSSRAPAQFSGGRLSRAAGAALARGPLGSRRGRAGPPGGRALQKLAGAATKSVARTVKRLLTIKVLAVLAVAAAVVVCVAFMLMFVTGAVRAGSDETTGTDTLECTPSASGRRAIPSRFLPLYGEAAARFGLAGFGVWVLASIHEIETGFGTGHAISSAGATGPMQFMPETWAKGHAGATRVVVPPTTDTRQGYATDGDGDGMADSENLYDAVHAAARYLANRAPVDWRGAIFAYNHANWYVDDVLAGANLYAGNCTATGAPSPGMPGRIVPIPWAPGEEINEGVLPLATYAHQAFGVRVSDAYDRDGSAGHKSPGHNVTGTAVDFIGTPSQLDAVVRWATGRGYRVYYDGRFGSVNLAGHGPNHHAHVEFPNGSQTI